MSESGENSSKTPLVIFLAISTQFWPFRNIFGYLHILQSRGGRGEWALDAIKLFFSPNFRISRIPHILTKKTFSFIGIRTLGGSDDNYLWASAIDCSYREYLILEGKYHWMAEPPVLMVWIWPDKKICCSFYAIKAEKSKVKQEVQLYSETSYYKASIL